MTQSFLSFTSGSSPAWASLTAYSHLHNLNLIRRPAPSACHTDENMCLPRPLPPAQAVDAVFKFRPTCLWKRSMLLFFHTLPAWLALGKIFFFKYHFSFERGRVGGRGGVGLSACMNVKHLISLHAPNVTSIAATGRQSSASTDPSASPPTHQTTCRLSHKTTPPCEKWSGCT